jgi:hypothetical protein
MTAGREVKTGFRPGKRWSYIHARRLLKGPSVLGLPRCVRFARNDVVWELAMTLMGWGQAPEPPGFLMLSTKPRPKAGPDP